VTGDLAETIIPKSDQLNADDLIGGPITITVREVVVKRGDDQPVSVFYDGDNGKPYKPNKGMRRLLMMAWKTDDSQAFLGRSMTLWRNPDVIWAGKKEGGIRISHLSHIDGEATFAVTVSRGKREHIKILPLRSDARPPIDDARDALANAGTLDDLRAVWSSKAMAPFRDALGEYLEQRKLELTPSPDENASEDDAPEAEELPVWHGMVEGWKMRIEQAIGPNVIIGVRQELHDQRKGLPDDVVAELDRLLDEGAAKFTTGE
jgi:hypothetical protein